jgi:hypothetical protein
MMFKFFIAFLYFLLLKNVLGNKFRNLKILTQKAQANCEILSNLVSIDKVGDEKYNLILTLTTADTCKLSCHLLSDNPKSALISSRLKDFYFASRHYNILVFEGLTQFTSYKYECFAENTQQSPKSYAIQFPKNKITKIATFGDWSICEDGKKSYNWIAKNIVQKNYDALVTLGDYGYDLHDDNGKVGNAFLEWITPIASYLPFMVSAGNHEFYKGDYHQYKKRFTMPKQAESENVYFSFDINDVHFISVASDIPLVNYKGDSFRKTFIKWFQDDVKNSKKKWKVVYMHRPIYCSWTSEPRCSSQGPVLRELFENLFFEQKIDLVIGGHLHCYERMYPIYKNEPDMGAVSADGSLYSNPKFPTYVICGSTGNVEGHCPQCKS